MTREEYNKLEGERFSTLKHILRSPAHYWTARNEPEEVDELRYAVGTMSHSLVLEGKDLTDCFALKPKGMSFATKEGKAWKAAQTLPILEEESAMKVPRMAEAVTKHPIARGILACCKEREKALQADLNGVLCKGLLDLYGRSTDGTPVIGDFKTTTDSRAWAFRKKATREPLHYDLQFGVYKELVRNCLDEEAVGIWIVQETSPPYTVMVYRESMETITEGRRKLNEVLDTWKRCTDENLWPAYAGQDQINEL